MESFRVLRGSGPPLVLPTWEEASTRPKAKRRRSVCAWWFVWARAAGLLRGCCANGCVAGRPTRAVGTTVNRRIVTPCRVLQCPIRSQPVVLVVRSIPQWSRR